VYSARSAVLVNCIWLMPGHLADHLGVEADEVGPCAAMRETRARLPAQVYRRTTRVRLVVPPAVSGYEADDEHNGGDHNGGDHEKAEQHAPTCEGHDVSFRVTVGKDCAAH
jgi:hypothetical protein